MFTLLRRQNETTLKKECPSVPRVKLSFPFVHFLFLNELVFETMLTK